MYNLETSLATTVDKSCGNASVSIVERFIQPISSTIFDRPEKYLGGTGPSISVSGPHEEFFNSAFGIWIGGKYFPNGCCRKIRMQKVFEGLRIEAYYGGTAIKTLERGRYETGKIGSWKTWYVNPHGSTKGSRNKGRSYTSAYSPGSYRNTTAEI